MLVKDRFDIVHDDDQEQYICKTCGCSFARTEAYKHLNVACSGQKRTASASNELPAAKAHRPEDSQTDDEGATVSEQSDGGGVATLGDSAASADHACACAAAADDPPAAGAGASDQAPLQAEPSASAAHQFQDSEGADICSSPASLEPPHAAPLSDHDHAGSPGRSTVAAATASLSLSNPPEAQLCADVASAAARVAEPAVGNGSACWDTHQLDLLEAHRAAAAADSAALQPDEEQVIAEFLQLEADAAQAAQPELSRSALTWAEAAQLSICELIPGTCTVMQAAYSILHNMISTSSTFDAASRNLDFINYTIFAGPPRPDNPNNRFPPSLHVCYQIVGVKDVSDFAVHMCPNGCMHWWSTFVTPSDHKGCQGCSTCRCPHCNCPRYHLVKGQWRAMYPVYFFPDVFQQFFSNKHWYDAVAAARAAKAAPWYSTPEYQRLEQFFTDNGVTLEVRPGTSRHCSLVSCTAEHTRHVA
jgi:hypothetical protein